jgi:hypothetical protein
MTEPKGKREKMSLDVYLQFEVDTGGPELRTFTVFEANYTHNCNTMASEAGIYEYVWRPEECQDVKTAKDLIEPLRRGIKLMEDDPKRFIALNPKNGWGSYDTFLPWLRNYLQACIENPKATIYACR